jgi:hypothetical protein
MEISLQTLVLRNFMGGSFNLSANCEDTNVYGSNGSGKTRLASALSWLLFDKDSQGKSDFEIKNLDAKGEEEHGLDHSVEGILCVDGIMMSLKKVYKEIWTKKRGSAKALFTGNTTDYFLDGVPVQKKDYVSRVSELAGDESAFRLLTSPIAFPSLHWTKQRTLLLEICGDMTDMQVIETNPALTPLIDMLERHKNSKKPFDDLKAVITSRRTEINKELEKVPVRIDEVRRGMPDVTGLDSNTTIKNIGILEGKLDEAKLRLQGIDNGATISDLSKKLAGVNADIARIEQAHYTDAMKTVNKLNMEINGMQEYLANYERRMKGIKDTIQYKKDTLSTMETKLARLRDQWSAINSEVFQDTTDEVCAACGQPLPSDRVDEAREKARANFNQRKAERLTEVEQEGKGISMAKGQLLIDIDKLHEELNAPTNIDTTNIERFIAERDEIKKVAENYNAIPDRAGLIITRTAIESDIAAARESVSIDREVISQDIAVLNGQIRGAKEQANMFTRREKGEERIEWLKQNEKDLATEFEKLEQELFLVELFIKTKVSLLTERINDKFELVRFKLFEVQVNGGISECCMLTINGIPYEGGLNNAARIQGGLDIIRTLQGHYALRAPVIIDNRESVTEIPAMGCQVISLVVSEKDPVLRVETATKSRQAA